MKFTRQHFTIALGLVLLTVGGSICLRVLWQSQQQPLIQPAAVSAAAAPAKPAPTAAAPAAASFISGQPAHLSVGSVHISLDVMPGYYNATQRTWTSSITKAVFAAVTTAPNNQAGNTFIYGHNRSSVFQRLLNAKLGDTAVVTTDNQHTFTYRLASVRDVPPTDLSVLASHQQPILTLQTCSGLFYQNRRMFVFNLVQAT